MLSEIKESFIAKIEQEYGTVVFNMLQDKEFCHLVQLITDDQHRVGGEAILLIQDICGRRPHPHNREFFDVLMDFYSFHVRGQGFYFQPVPHSTSGRVVGSRYYFGEEVEPTNSCYSLINHAINNFQLKEKEQDEFKKTHNFMR